MKWKSKGNKEKFSFHWRRRLLHFSQWTAGCTFHHAPTINKLFISCFRLLFLGLQGRVDVKFKSKVKTLIHITTKNRIRCASGPVHSSPSILLHKYKFHQINFLHFFHWVYRYTNVDIFPILKDKERPKPISDIEKWKVVLKKWFYCFSHATSYRNKMGCDQFSFKMDTFGCFQRKC